MQNVARSAAAMDLGLGGLLADQAKETEDERRKKLLKPYSGLLGDYGDTVFSQASNMLLG